MPMAQRQMPWPAMLLLAAVAAAIYGATSFGWRPSAPPAVGAASSGPSVCVTRYVLCGTRPGRAGDPCSCPHLLRGMVPGHIERLGDEPVLPYSNDWDQSPASPAPDDWDLQHGP